MESEDLPYADKINYWKTGKSSADVWLEKAQAQIERFGGQVLIRAVGMDPQSDRKSFLMVFEMDGDRYRIVWPVLRLKLDTVANVKAAERQAATLLYHDVKARSLSSAVLGTRRAFFSYLMLPDGRVASEARPDEIVLLGRAIFGSAPELVQGETVEEEDRNGVG